MSSPSVTPDPSPANSPNRRALPALICLLVLCLLTALVWWRVITRDDGNAQTATDCSTAPAKPTTLPLPAYVTVAVYNSTPRQGLASKAAKALKTDGFKVPDQATNDPHNKLIAGVAEIRYGPTGADAAATLAYYVPGATMVSTDSTDSTVAVSLGAKFAKLATTAEVQTAVKAAGVTLVEPKPTTGTPLDTCTPSATVTATVTATATGSPSGSSSGS
ncbi:MAG TPA: LytR C-terminal domain-containing protein [Jatrophihabitans sp.]|jgi:hypothetical protein